MVPVVLSACAAGLLAEAFDGVALAFAAGWGELDWLVFAGGAVEHAICAARLKTSSAVVKTGDVCFMRISVHHR